MPGPHSVRLAPSPFLPPLHRFSSWLTRCLRDKTLTEHTPPTGFELSWSLKEPKQSIFPTAHPSRTTRAHDYLVMLSDIPSVKVRLSVLNNQLGVHPKFVDTARMLGVANSLHAAISRASAVAAAVVAPSPSSASSATTDEISLSALLATSADDSTPTTISSSSSNNTGNSSSSSNSNNTGVVVPSIDTAALFFGALALGSCYNSQDLRETNWLFAESTDLSSAYTGPPTLDLLGAQYLQHMFLLGTGSANQAKAMIVQALHTANHVGFGSPGGGGGTGSGSSSGRGGGGGKDDEDGQRALMYYLLVNFADQSVLLPPPPPSPTYLHSK